MKRTLIPILLMIVCVLTFGCADHRKARMDANHGRAYETAKFSQILNPDAENNLDPVTGFEGTAAINTLDKYQRDFKKEESTSKVFNINVSE